MRTVIQMNHGNRISFPAEIADEDVRSSDQLVEHFIRAYTKPGDVVFDPFAGFGTTLTVAERLRRIGYGIEFLQDRVEYIRSIVENKANIFHGSALEMEKFDLPEIDFSFTSPPYMSANDHPQYPFTAYEITGDGYGQYLQDIQSVYRQLKRKLKPNAVAVIEASNIINHGRMTPLAWDIARSVGEVLHLEKEIIVQWDGDSAEGTYGFGYDHCYCLIFRNR